MIFAYANKTAFRGDSHMNIKSFIWRTLTKHWFLITAQAFSPIIVTISLFSLLQKHSMVMQNSVLKYNIHSIV